MVCCLEKLLKVPFGIGLFWVLEKSSPILEKGVPMEMFLDRRFVFESWIILIFLERILFQEGSLVWI